MAEQVLSIVNTNEYKLKAETEASSTPLEELLMRESKIDLMY